MDDIHIRFIENPTDAHIDAAVKVFARAFKDELVIRSATGGNPDLFDPFFRSRMDEAKFNGRLYLAISRNDTDELEEMIVGAAYWTIFEKSNPMPEVVQKSMDEYDQRLDPVARDWWHSRFLPPIGTLLCQYSERVWHLKYIGVLPEYKQRGIGKALVLPLRDQAKTEGWNFSLVTQTANNVKFYERLGFRVAGTTIITDGPCGDVPAYVMVDGFTN